MYWSLENVPWTNLHDLNLDWIVNTMKQTVEQWIAYRLEMDGKYADFTEQVNSDFDEFTTGINEWKTLIETEFSDLQTYVQDYFDNLDLNESTRYVINQMIASGEFIEVLNPSIVAATEAWLASHVTPTSPAVDNTLTIEGAAADAKVTGNKVNELTNKATAIAGAVQYDLTWTPGWINTNGDIMSPSSALYSEVYSNEYILTRPGDKITFCLNYPGYPEYNVWVRMAFYNLVENEYHFVNRQDTLTTTGDFITYTWENTFSRPYYFRVTLRSGMNGSGSYLVLKKYSAEHEYQLEELSKRIQKSEYVYQNQEIFPTWTINKYLTLNVVDGSAVNLTQETEFTGAQYAIVPCSPGDVFTFYGTGLSVDRLWAFLDSSNNMLDKSSLNAMSFGKRLIAPTGASKLVIQVNNTYYYALLKGNSGIYGLYPGTIFSTNNNKDHYINTSVGYNQTVSLTPIWFSGFTYMVLPCDYGDEFLITGHGGDAGRLWAFLDINNKMLADFAPPDTTLINGRIAAPKNAKTLVVNSWSSFGLVVTKGSREKLGNITISKHAMKPNILDLPKDIVAMPSVTFSEYLQQTEGVSGAKSTIYKNGDYFCVTYGENVDGTGTDIPLLNTTGCLEMKYKRFKLVDGVESEVSYGTFAKKGDSYTKYDGTSGSFEGGCGLPSGINNLQFFTAAYHSDSSDPLNTFAGISGYGMTPCCCTVNVDENGVSFGTLRELKLVYNGVEGPFDLRRIDPAYPVGMSYLTTGAPSYNGSYYMWFQPITMGVVYMWSYDGVTWTATYIFDLPVQPICETNSAFLNNRHYVTVRTNSRNTYQNDTLYLLIINSQNNKPILAMYNLPFAESRTQLVVSGSEVLLFYSPGIKSIVECIRIVAFNNTQWSFWKWFTIYTKCTWYLTVYQNNLNDENFEKMYLCGGNSSDGSPDGMTFMELTFNTTKPRSPYALPPAVL